MKRFLPIFIFLFISNNAFSLTEIGADFGYQRQVYGNDRQNDIVTKTYSGSIAFYFLESTALEFNYYESQELTEEKNTVPVTGTNVDVVRTENSVLNRSYGIGLRQAFAGRKAFLRPTLSLGYARQFVTDNTSIDFQDRSTGVVTTFRDNPSKLRSDSVFGTFALQLRLTKTLSFRASVNTIFAANDFGSAGDNLKYMAGITWYL